MQCRCEEYPPSEDTFLLCDYVRGISGGSALEIGAGSGYVSRVLEENFGLVVCTEISRRVLADQTYPAGNRVCCNAADALRGRFDLIVSNPPYLDTPGISFRATDGGRDGVEVSCMFLRSAAPLLGRDGQIAMVASSLSRHDVLADLASSLGLNITVAMRKKLFFEELYVLRMAYR